MRVIVNISNGTYKVLVNPSKRKVSGLSTVLHGKDGYCTVEYRRGWKNEFEWNGWDDFKKKVSPCIEKQLLKEFK